MGRSTEDGTLLIHIDRNMPSDIMPSMTFSGLFPNGRRSTEAIMLEMRCFSRTAPIEKPAMKSSTVGSKNCTTSARRGSSASLDAEWGGRNNSGSLCWRGRLWKYLSADLLGGLRRLVRHKLRAQTRRVARRARSRGWWREECAAGD